MMSCKELVDLMADYLEGQLEPDAARDLDQHLADCPRCLDFLAEELIKAYQEAADHRAPRAFATTGAGLAQR
jgi:anti-sigma factor RsiW